MSVLTTENANEAIINCNCGCGQGLGIRVTPDFWKEFGDYAYLDTYVSGSEYDRNGFRSNIEDLLRAIKETIKNDRLYRQGICISEKDFKTLADWCDVRMKEALKNKTVPEDMSDNDIFVGFTDSPSMFMYHTNERVVHFDISRFGEDDYELAFFINTKGSKNKIKTILSLLKPKQQNLPEIALTKSGFGRFCKYVKDKYRIYTENI